MFCQNCGSELPGDVKFCVECGAEVARVSVAEKPVTFEKFMASRGAGKSEGTALDLQFQAAQKAKRKERSAQFKPKGKKRADETVKINVGLVDINKEGTELKIKRASHLPVSVPRTATDVLVKRKAVEKHMAHNKDLRAESLESDMQWILLYPDLDVVLYIPGTKECFSIAKYKESIGKPYNRVNLYLCRKRDYEAALASDDTDTEQADDPEKTLHDSSGEITLNIPKDSPDYSDRQGKEERERKTPSIASLDSLPPCAWDEPSTSGSYEHPGSNYNAYCDVMDEGAENDLELQEAIFRSARDDFAVIEERESLETLLRRFTNERAVDEEDYQIIRVRRKYLWDDTVRAATKEGFRCNVRLKVHFIGEEAEDEGGPLREFFRLALRAVCNNSGIPQGADDRKTFSCNPMLLQRGSYFCAGLITGMSLQQGGPGLHCLSPAVYEHLTGGAALATPVLQDVADFDSKMRIEKISSAMNKNQLDKAVSEESEFLLECGITRVTWEFKEKRDLELLLCKSNVIYRPKAAVDQFIEGLELVGLLRYMREHPSALKSLFCFEPRPLAVQSFRQLLKINFTEPGSNESNSAREGEEATILWWEEFLDKLEASDPHGLLPQLLIFISGADNIPPLGFDRVIEIDFFNYRTGVRRFPTSSTCGLGITLPRGMPSYEEFEDLIVQALKEGSHDFGKL